MTSRVAILGSTGSIGQSALAVVRRIPIVCGSWRSPREKTSRDSSNRSRSYPPDTVAMASSAGLAEAAAGLRSLSAPTSDDDWRAGQKG